MTNNPVGRFVVTPMLEVLKRNLAEARAEGLTEDNIKDLFAAAVLECCRNIEDEEERIWMVQQLREAMRPPHEGPETVQ